MQPTLNSCWVGKLIGHSRSVSRRRPFARLMRAPLGGATTKTDSDSLLAMT